MNILSNSKKTILITGVSGFLGGIVKTTIEKDNNVITAGRNNEVIFIDLSDPKTVENASCDNVDVCIHIAGATENNLDEIEVGTINILGTRALLEFCKKNNIKKFIFISTMHVFGNLQGTIDELREPYPNREYGMTHFLAEQYVTYYRHNKKMDTCILRLSNVYGIPSNLEQFNRWSLIPFGFTKEAISKGKITINSNGKQIRNFISAIDVANLIQKLMVLPTMPPILHVHSKQDLSVFEIASLIKENLIKNFGIGININVNTDDLSIPTSYKFTSRLLENIYVPELNIEDFFNQLIPLLFKLEATNKIIKGE